MGRGKRERSTFKTSAREINKPGCHKTPSLLRRLITPSFLIPHHRLLSRAHTIIYTQGDAGVVHPSAADDKGQGNQGEDSASITEDGAMPLACFTGVVVRRYVQHKPQGFHLESRLAQLLPWRL